MGLPDKCLIACSCAYSQMDDIIRQLTMRDITVQDLEKIQEYLEQMKRLCYAINNNRSITDDQIFLVKQRLEELRAYQDQQGNLQHLCSRIPSSIKGKMLLCSAIFTL